MGKEKLAVSSPTYGGERSAWMYSSDALCGAVPRQPPASRCTKYNFAQGGRGVSRVVWHEDVFSRDGDGEHEIAEDGGTTSAGGTRPTAPRAARVNAGDKYGTVALGTWGILCGRR